MSKAMEPEMLETIVQIIIEKYLPWLLLDTEFLKNGKIRELTFGEQRHFIGVLTLKRAGKLDKTYYSQKALDSLVASHLEIGRKTCHRLHLKLQSLELVDENWQPLGWKRWQYDKASRTAGAVASIVRAHEAQQGRKKEAMSNAERQRKYRRKSSVQESSDNEARNEVRNESNEARNEVRNESNEARNEKSNENWPESNAVKQPETRMNSSLRNESNENFPLHIQEQEQKHI